MFTFCSAELNLNTEPPRVTSLIKPFNVTFPIAAIQKRGQYANKKKLFCDFCHVLVDFLRLFGDFFGVIFMLLDFVILVASTSFPSLSRFLLLKWYFQEDFLDLCTIMIKMQKKTTKLSNKNKQKNPIKM